MRSDPPTRDRTSALSRPDVSTPYWISAVGSSQPIVASSDLHRPSGGDSQSLRVRTDAVDIPSGVSECCSPRITPLEINLLGAVWVLGQIISQAIDRDRTAFALRASETLFRIIVNADGNLRRPRCSVSAPGRLE